MYNSFEIGAEALKYQLFTSYKFVKGFFAIFFYFFLFLTETFIMCVNVFFIQLGTQFQLDPTKDKEFPHRPPL